LSSYALRVSTNFAYGEDSQIRGVDWESNYANPPGNVSGIRAPLLVLGMTAGWEGLAAETIFGRSASADKSMAFIEGATHDYTPARAPGDVPGRFGDTVETTYAYIDQWLSSDGRLI